MNEILCQISTAKLGLVPLTKCGKTSTTRRATSWTRDVTCPDCLEQMRLDRIKVDAANAVGKPPTTPEDPAPWTEVPHVDGD